MGHENSVQANHGQDFCHVRGGDRDAEAVACVAGDAIERDESGDTGGIDALRLTRSSATFCRRTSGVSWSSRALLAAADEFGQSGRFRSPGSCHLSNSMVLFINTS